MSRTGSSRLRRIILPAWLVVGDAVFAFAGLALGFWLRYKTPLSRFGIDVPDAVFADYVPLLLLGVLFLIAGYAQLNLYEERLLLRKFQGLALIIKGTTLWLAGYLALAVVLKFEPPISRLFVPLAYLSIIGVMFVWRSAFYAALVRPAWSHRIRQRVGILGWNDEARALGAELAAQPAHP
jgi:FlaA1/EpsC-like NDP-sugar epimerase